MIDVLNYNYYGIPEGKEAFATWDSDIILGPVVNEEIWGYYYVGLYPPDYHPENIPHVGKPLDDSVYVWHLPNIATYASNAAVNISVGNTLNVDVAFFQDNSNVPLAVAAMDKNSISSYSGFSTDPADRLANNDSNPVNYVSSPLFYDINYSLFCVCPAPQIFRKDNNTLNGRYLDESGTSSLRQFINGDPDNRDLSFIRMDLYAGEAGSREVAIAYHTGNSYEGYVLPDVLTYRPIPDSCTVVKDILADASADPPHIPAWDDTKVYNPFAMALRQNWGSGDQFTGNYQMNIGINQQYGYNQIRNGREYYRDLDHKITGQFFRYNTVAHYFDDVAYQWEFKILDINSGRFIENGLDITNKTGNVRIMTLLKILDDKGVSKGEATERAVKHEIAFLGFYFAKNQTLTINGILGTQGDGIGIYLPEKIGGVTTGKYFTGDAIKNVPYADATSCADFKYEPDDVYNDSTPSLNNSIVTAESVHMYAQVPITTLITNLNAIPSIDPDDGMIDVRKFFFGADPYSFILGYYITPKFFIPQWYISEYRQHPDVVKLGKYECDNRYGAPAPVCYAATLKTPLRRLFLKDVYIKRLFNNFLDYEPYSSLSLYLPFMGTIELPPSIFVGNTLSVYSSYDLISGMVTYMIYAGETQYVTKSALARIDMPFHGRDISDYSRNMLSAYTERNVTMFNMISSLGSTVGRAGTAASISSNKLNPEGMISSSIGGVGSILGSIGSSIATANMYDTILMKSSPNPSTISMGSIADGFANTLTPYIIRTVPEYASGFKTEKYGKINGFACYHNDTISNYHGFTVIENPILDDIPISQAEKELLRTLLHKGVILP